MRLALLPELMRGGVQNAAEKGFSSGAGERGKLLMYYCNKCA